MGRAYLIVSGKGGTGKTTVSTSLALALARMGRQVLLFDGDVGLRCCDLLMGMEDLIVYDAGDVLEWRCTLEEAATPHPQCQTLRLLSAPQMASPGDMSKKAIRQLHAGLILNRVDRFLIGVKEEKRPGDIAAALDLPLIGGIPESYDVYRGILMHKTALECDAANVRRAVTRIARRLTGQNVRFPRFYHVIAPPTNS